MSSSDDDQTFLPYAQPHSPITQATQESLDLDEIPSIDHPDPNATSQGAIARTSEGLSRSRQHHGKALGDNGGRLGSDPPDPRRLNKWHGAVSTWREYTAAEIELARTLDHLKARDLSVHLFNAYALKVQARSLRAQLPNGRKNPQSQVWEPQNMWTAWPMKSNEVPRSTVNIATELFEENTLPIPVVSDVCSNRNLEDCLLAIFTSFAREHTRMRMEDGVSEQMGQDTQNTRRQEGTPALKGPDTKSASLPRQQRSKSLGEDEDSTRVLSIEHDEDHGQEISEHTEVDDEATTQDEAEIHPGKPKADSQSGTRPDPYRPIPIADDDAVKRLVQPSLSHILTSLETLLQGLHHTRHFQRKRKRPIPQFNPQSKKRTGRSPMGSKGGMQKQGIDASRKKQRLERPIQNGSDSSNSAYHGAEDSEVGEVESENAGLGDMSPRSATSSPPKQAKERQNAPKGAFGAQGWSDVLGVAAIQGWNKDVLERSRARCSALFGEHMDLIKLDLNRPVVRRPQYTAYKDEAEGGVRVDGFFRPIEKQHLWKMRDRSSRQKKAASAPFHEDHDEQELGPVEED